MVFNRGCPKFCVELSELPKNLEKDKKDKNFGEEKEEKNATNLMGVFAKINTGLKKSILINASISAQCIFLANTPFKQKSGVKV